MATLAAAYEPQPMFEPKSRAAYVLGLFIVAATVVLFYAMGFSISPNLGLPWFLLAFFVCGPLARRVGHPKIAGALECLGFLYGEAIFLFTLLPLTALSGPLADARLAAWDRAIGFDWVAFVTWAKPLVPLFDFAYRSFALQALFLVSILFYTGNDSRAWRLATSAMIALIICASLYPFFPAVSAMAHYGVYPIADHEAVVSGPVIAEIKNGARVVTFSMLKGLITFPSYHAAAAVMLAWAAWPVRLIRWPVLALNVVMAVACVVVGSHYLVDVLGGVVIAAVSLCASRLPMRNHHQPVATSAAHALR